MQSPPFIVHVDYPASFFSGRGLVSSPSSRYRKTPRCVHAALWVILEESPLTVTPPISRAALQSPHTRMQRNTC